MEEPGYNCQLARYIRYDPHEKKKIREDVPNHSAERQSHFKMCRQKSIGAEVETEQVIDAGRVTWIVLEQLPGIKDESQSAGNGRKVEDGPEGRVRATDAEPAEANDTENESCQER